MNLRRLVLPIALLGAWIAGSTLGAIPAPRPAQAAPLFQIEAAHAEHRPTLDGSTPVFLLVIGSDARPGEDPSETRADSIHLVGVNAAEGKASIVGFPRDAYVPIPGMGTNKINSALVYGGPELLVQTVEELMGVTVDYWALTWFEGFVAMIRDVGGLSMDVPFDVFDDLARAEIEAGPQVLSGAAALAFARARHALPQGDFGRSENQGRLMIAALAQFKKELTRDPARLLTWVGAGLRNARTDVPLDELITLAFTGASVNAKHVPNIVLPGSVQMAGNVSVVSLNSSVLQTIASDLQDDGLISKANVLASPNAALLDSVE
ncbi:MAG TPA: LCP family protein [Actinomycetota bacterium]|nr:LCP family protein [Actinomycetota bacterium]